MFKIIEKFSDIEKNEVSGHCLSIESLPKPYMDKIGSVRTLKNSLRDCGVPTPWGTLCVAALWLLLSHFSWELRAGLSYWRAGRVPSPPACPHTCRHAGRGSGDSWGGHPDSLWRGEEGGREKARRKGTGRGWGVWGLPRSAPTASAQGVHILTHSAGR